VKSKKRMMAAVMAVLLAVLGVGALVVYTKTAQDRAFQGTETVEVLRVKEQVPAGTKASDIEDKVERVKLPRAAVPADIITDVDRLGSKVTTATLVPGEVLVGARFTGSSALKGSGPIEVPRGLQEVSIEISATRTVSGTIQPGDFVGVIASYEPPRGDYVTNFVLNKVLVLAVSGGVAQGESAVGASVLQVRLALESEAVQKVVNAAEFGKIYLSRQGSGAKTGRAVITPEDVVQ
jgi:pilus assembly protein CpaB